MIKRYKRPLSRKKSKSNTASVRRWYCLLSPDNFSTIGNSKDYQLLLFTRIAEGGSNESVATANSSSNGLQSFRCRPPRARPLSELGSEHFCRRSCCGWRCTWERKERRQEEAQVIVYSSCFC
ncbi:hypothetical protein NPIL_153101 [Nephila pilipes]|uniref:Uncharacterized protein n=1 Tax=Nephila pilipes TaxID=299642 RepID=A0A8X6PC95_NEPPI|nr:hypothetical protein NPIL_153101 [Nephila pilipes]